MFQFLEKLKQVLPYRYTQCLNIFCLSTCYACGRFFCVCFHKKKLFTQAFFDDQHFYLCSIHAGDGYKLSTQTVIRLLKIKFQPLKICIRAVWDAFPFTYCQETDELILNLVKTYFICSMHV